MKLRSFISLVVRRYLCRRLRGFRGNPWSIDPTDAEELAAYLEGGTTTGAHSFTHTEYHRYLDEVLRILHGELNERDWRIFVKLYVKHETPRADRPVRPARPRAPRAAAEPERVSGTFGTGPVRRQGWGTGTGTSRERQR